MLQGCRQLYATVQPPRDGILTYQKSEETCTMSGWLGQVFPLPKEHVPSNWQGGDFAQAKRTV